MTVNEMHSGVGSGLAWAARRWAILVLLLIVAGTATAVAVQRSQEPSYDARALVSANSIVVNPIVLPRFGQDVFNSGPVADAVAAVPTLQLSTDQVIPGSLSLDAQQDAVTYTVIGHASNAVKASTIANVGADAFVKALNAPGKGLGQFSVISSARTPIRADRPLSPLVAVAAGALAGLALAVGFLLLMVMFMRPIVDQAGIVYCGVLSLGEVRLQRGARASGVAGLAAFLRRLGINDVRTIAFVNPGRRHARDKMTAAVNETLSLTSRVHPRPAGEAAAPYEVTPLAPSKLLQRIAAAERPDRVVLVVPEGLPARKLLALTAELLPEDVDGAVLVRERRSLARAVRAGRAHFHRKGSDPLSQPQLLSHRLEQRAEVDGVAVAENGHRSPTQPLPEKRRFPHSR